MILENGIEIKYDIIEYDIPDLLGIRMIINEGNTSKTSKILYIPKFNEIPNEEEIHKIILRTIGPGMIETIVENGTYLRKLLGPQLYNLMMGFSPIKSDSELIRDIVTENYNPLAEIPKQSEKEKSDE